MALSIFVTLNGTIMSGARIPMLPRATGCFPAVRPYQSPLGVALDLADRAGITFNNSTFVPQPISAVL